MSSIERPVLIVEDAETCASILEIIFTSINGVKVITASSGDQAWEMLSSQPEPVRAIVTDLHMPGMDGFELMERVRGNPLHAGVPIIVITGCTDVDAAEQARLRGATAVFMKPYSPARVREKLEQLLSDDTPRG
jgi:CheY-like chemotaxis protein